MTRHFRETNFHPGANFIAYHKNQGRSNGGDATRRKRLSRTIIKHFA